MADQPLSTLPTFYGEKTTDGRVVKRLVTGSAAEDQEAPVTSAGPATTTATRGPQIGSMAFGDAGPLRDELRPMDRRNRWTIDDPRARGPNDYWNDQWERRRWERERDRDWFPDHRGPQRYLEWEPEDRRIPVAYFSSGSRRSNAPLHYRPGRRGYGGYRRYDSDEEYEEELYPNRAGGAGGGGVGGGHADSGPSRTEPENMRLPFTGWMGAFKGRMSPGSAAHIREARR